MSGYWLEANPAVIFCRRSSVVGAPAETLIVTFGWSLWNSLASCSSFVSAVCACPVHQVSVTGALVSAGPEDPPAALQPARTTLLTAAAATPARSLLPVFRFIPPAPSQL